MRVYLSGDEDTCKWHLPVVQSMLNNWVLLCQKSGIKQNTFQHVFEDTGTTVQAQYTFGTVSVQLHAPSQHKESAKQEESKVDLSCPRVFYIETSGGYFWVIVQRDADGVPLVRLEQFTPTDADGFVFQIMGHQTPGMLASSINKKRYVVTQGAGVFTGECNEKGLVLLPPSCDGIGRITPDFAIHKYVIVAGDYESKSIRMVDLSFLGGKIVADLKYTEASSLLAVDAGQLAPTALHPNPCWVHRKCFGSYFSPNKTIGYHVDIGIDDEFLGNMSMVRGGDLLDNTGGFPEAMFNHTKDLARFISLLNFPIAVSGSTVTIVLESPTMSYMSETGEKCWGGYAITQSEYGCADYQRDFSPWLLAPRAVTVVCDLVSGAMEFSDIAGIATEAAADAQEYEIFSWDDKFKTTLVFDVSHKCDTVSYSEFFPVDTIDGNCDWTEECTGDCGIDDETTYSGECAKIWDVLKYRSDFFREELSVCRKLYLVFGGRAVSPFSPQDMTAFFFMFDGFWHLDVGLHWSRQEFTGDFCSLCSTPQAGQYPGGLIWFYVGGSSGTEHIGEVGHEYTENLEIVTPLGIIPGPYGFDVFGFVAKVPEYLAAPHEPVVLTGGIRYTSAMDSDAHVECEKYLMSTPCECTGNELVITGDSYVTAYSGIVAIDGGCEPFYWYIRGADIIDPSTGANLGYKLSKTTMRGISVIAHEPKCGISVLVRDACNRSVSIESEIVTGDIDGPDIMSPGTTATFSLDTNTSSVSYSGSLELISQSGSSVVVKMPDDACGGEYSVTLSACGTTKTKLVRPTAGYWKQIGMYSWPWDSWSGIGIAVYSVYPWVVPGWMDKDYNVLNSESYFGKYKCVDAVVSYRTATPEACAATPRHFPIGTVCRTGAHSYGTTTDCEYFHESYAPDGSSRGACANGYQSRILYEWSC